MSGRGQSGRKLADLLAGALGVWGLRHRVALRADGAGGVVLSSPDGVSVEVRPAAADGIGGWVVVATRPPPEGGPARRRETAHEGVPGMLRTVRAALAPEQRPGRMVVAPAPGRE